MPRRNSCCSLLFPLRNPPPVRIWQGLPDFWRFIDAIILVLFSGKINFLPGIFCPY
jgi:hypothetical protein